MSIEKKQLREMVQDVLMYLDPEVPYSQSAEELVLLTIATESHGGKWFKQEHGPAKGIIQMEPNTESDLWSWIERTQPNALVKKLTVLHGSMAIFNRGGKVRSIDPSQYNLAYQIAMCRMFYRRVAAPLPVVQMIDFMETPVGPVVTAPSHDSLFLLAHYWKEHYNTRLGKGIPATAVQNYIRFVS